jgi:hypothetical protein
MVWWNMDCFNVKSSWQVQLPCFKGFREEWRPIEYGLWFCWGNSRTGNSGKEEISNVCWTVMVEMSGVCVCLLMALILQIGVSVGLWYLMTVMLCIPVFCSCSTSSVQAHWTTYCCARTCATGRRVCRYDTTCHIWSSGSETNECRSDINVTVWIQFAVEILYAEVGVAEGCGLQAFDTAIGWAVRDDRILVLPSVESSSEKKSSLTAWT